MKSFLDFTLLSLTSTITIATLILHSIDAMKTSFFQNQNIQNQL